MTLRARGFFVTGTDTGVGKTVVACALVRALRAEGIDIAAMKPAETGVGEAGPLDAIALREAAGGTDDLADVCPLQFALPTAPNVAAHAEGSKVDLSRVDRAFARIASRHAAVVVEGAGGLLVPTTDDETMADLASRLGLPLLLVARAALGTINHTRLCLDAIAARGLDCVGVVISHSDGRLSHADERNLDWLRRWLGERLLGEIRPLSPGALPELDAIRLEPFLERLA